jgi:acetyl-CoA synthetase
MRRLLRELAATGEVKGDTTTLEDFTVVAKLKEKDED